MKKLYLTIFVLLLTILTTKLQSHNKDSLDKLYKNLSNEDSKQTVIDAHNLCKQYRNYSLDTSLLIAKRAIEISKNLKNDSLWSMSEIYLAMIYTLKDNQDSSFKYYFKAMERSPQSDFIVATCANLLGISYRRIGDHAKSEKYALKSLRLFKKIGSAKNYATSLGNYSNLLQSKGEFEKAIEYSLKASNILDSLHDSLNLAIRYGTIANIYCDIDDQKSGIHFFKKGLSIVDKEKNPGLYYKFIFNLATTYDENQKYDSAIILYNQSLKFYRKVNDAEGIAIANQNIGLSLIKKHKYRQAINYLQNAFLQFSNLYTIRNISDVLSDLGLAYSSAGISDSAVLYMEMSIDTAIKYNLLREERKTRKLLYEVYKTRGDWTNALINFEKYKTIEDSISSETTKEKMAELSIEYEAGLKDEKIKQLELNERITQAKTTTFIIILISVTILFVLIITILYYRKRTQNKLLSIKSKLWEKEKAELDKELAYKKKQLSSHALHMTQKNKILQNIRKAVNEITPYVPDSTSVKIKDLQSELNKSLRYDKDWKVFSMYFNELNKDFFEKLSTINPKLSQYDLRLAALLRMSMNIKEAAAVLNIEPDSVKTARYKLRKKLGLQPNDDLVKFIAEL